MTELQKEIDERIRSWYQLFPDTMERLLAPYRKRIRDLEATAIKQKIIKEGTRSALVDLHDRLGQLLKDLELERDEQIFCPEA